ncbi:MAG TPA: hypothetical protein VMP67_01065 [Candidatus Limnocylindria bacterium]|nr:hypothetical protein [Candidatus Limnocylindria bacterium]
MHDQDKPGQGNPGPGKPGQGKASPRAHAALARLAEAVSDPERRKSLRSDPAGTVKGYEELPESVRTTMERMSDDELQTLAEAHQAFADAGFYTDLDDEYGGGRVSFF